MAFVNGVQSLTENTITLQVPTSNIAIYSSPNGGLKTSTNASLLELLIRYSNRLCSDSRDKPTLSRGSSGIEVLVCGLTITRNWANSFAIPSRWLWRKREN
jgi:hypothetical protein